MYNVKLDRTFMISAIVSLLIGISIFLFGIKERNDYNYKKEHYTPVTGVIVDYKVDNDSDGDTSYAPIVNYEVNGVIYTYSSGYYSNRRPTLGNDVVVRYNPDDPNDSILENEHGYVVFFVVGSLFSICGLVLLIAKMIESRKKELISDNSFNSNYEEISNEMNDTNKNFS